MTTTVMLTTWTVFIHFVVSQTPIEWFSNKQAHDRWYPLAFLLGNCPIDVIVVYLLDMPCHMASSVLDQEAARA